MNMDEIKALENDHEVCLCMDVSLKEIIDSVEAGGEECGGYYGCYRRRDSL